MNVPSASHVEGAWEWQIRSVYNVLSTLLESNRTQLNDESLGTLMCKAEAVINSGPLRLDTLTDPDSLCPLTPNHLLTVNSRIIMPPPGVMQDADKYSRRCRRRVQHTANEFWSLWKKGFLESLQTQLQWHQLVKTFAPRILSSSRMITVLIISGNLHVIEVHNSKDGHVGMKTQGPSCQGAIEQRLLSCGH